MGRASDSYDSNSPLTPQTLRIDHLHSLNMPGSSRRDQNSSEESNFSGMQGSEFSFASDSKPSPSQPALWTPSDRLGLNGRRDRLRRRDRLVKTIQLSPEELRDVMLFIYENETYDGMHWTEEVLYKYVPKTFETAIVGQASAQYALNNAIGRNFRRHIPAIHLESHSSDDSPMRRCVYVFSHHKMDIEIPAPLKNLPNVTFIEEPPLQIHPEGSVQAGCKITVPENTVLRLGETFSSGTLGFVGTMENLGPTRHVLITVGHVVDEAAKISVHTADNNIYPTEFVDQFERFLGVPTFRIDKPDVPGPVSLNQICFLESPAIAELRCVFQSTDCCGLGIQDDAGQDDDPSLVARGPIFADMRKLEGLVRKNDGITVYKLGNASGLTTGILSDVQKPDDDLSVFRLKIKWVSPGDPFAVSGDSGSLIWAKDRATIIPLGLHCGSKGITSYSFSLQSICQDVSNLLDADLFFCIPDECGSNAVCDMPSFPL